MKRARAPARKEAKRRAKEGAERIQTKDREAGEAAHPRGNGEGLERAEGAATLAELEDRLAEIQARADQAKRDAESARAEAAEARRRVEEARAHRELQSPGEDTGVVGLTEVSFDELRALGMSVIQAKRLLAYRDRLGGFDSLDDLDGVPGFSRALLARIRERLTR